MTKFLTIFPNLLTASRIFFTLGFLLLVGLADRSLIGDPERIGPEVWRFDWAFVLFIIAGITDIIDGPLARRWNATSQFGRSFDPFVDKLLIGGGFILLASFTYPLSGIAWWMVILLLAREVFVTVIRSVSESKGKEFGATWAGKVKMFLQSFAIGTVLIYIGHHQLERWALIFRDTAVWVAIIFTLLSGLAYLPRLKSIK